MICLATLPIGLISPRLDRFRCAFRVKQNARGGLLNASADSELVIDAVLINVVGSGN